MERRVKKRGWKRTNLDRPLNLRPFGPDCTDQIYLIAAGGFSDEEIARIFGVSAGKLARWRLLYPDLDKAISTGRLAPDMAVVQAAYRRAVGYEVPVKVVTETTDPEGNVTTTVKTEMQHIAPDPASQRFWLQNRAGDRWKDKRTEEKIVTHELGKRLSAALERVGASRLPPPDAIDAELVEVSAEAIPLEAPPDAEAGSAEPEALLSPPD